MTSLSDLQPGDTVPDLVKAPISRTQLALFAGASGDHNPIHLDDDEARKGGLPGVIAHGMLNMAFLGQLLTGLVPQRRIRAFQARFVGMTRPGDVITCGGTVTGRTESGGETFVDLKITARTRDGTTVLDGTARIAVD